MRLRTCAWVRARLPLLVGGDSLGLDRWLVQRHLLRCADCRRRQAALERGQAALNAAAAVDPIPEPEAPPLWPEIQRRIAASKRPRARTAWGVESRWAWVWPMTGLAAGLLVAASIVGLGAQRDPRVADLVRDYFDVDLLSARGPSRGSPELLKFDEEETRQLERQRRAERSRGRNASHAALSTETPRGREPREADFEADAITR